MTKNKIQPHKNPFLGKGFFENISRLLFGRQSIIFLCILFFFVYTFVYYFVTITYIERKNIPCFFQKQADSCIYFLFLITEKRYLHFQIQRFSYTIISPIMTPHKFFSSAQNTTPTIDTTSFIFLHSFFMTAILDSPSAQSRISIFLLKAKTINHK